MSDQQKSLVRGPGQGRTVAVVGDIYRFLAVGAETGGRYATWEAIVLPGGGPPPHTHSREHESFYVIEGEVTLYSGNERIVVRAGTFANMTPGSPHHFRNESDQPARMLISVAPAGLEKMFFEVGQPVEPGTHPSPPNPAEIDRLLAVAPQYGIEIHLPQG